MVLNWLTGELVFLKEIITLVRYVLKEEALI